MPTDAQLLYYTILMRIYEVGGPISDTPEALARRTGMRIKRVQEALAYLEGEGKINYTEADKIDSKTTHEFLSSRESKIHGAKLSAEIRWSKHKGKQHNSDANAMPRQCYIEEDIERKKKIPKKKVPNGVLEILMVGGGLTEQTAKDVLEHRRAIEKPLTSRAAKMLAKDLFDWGDGEIAAATMIRKGWRGFESKWAENLGMKRPANGHAHINGASSGIFVKRDTPQWEAWQVWWMKTKGKSMPGGDGWFCPSEYPPETQQ